MRKKKLEIVQNFINKHWFYIIASVLLTPFSYQNVPPPMSALSLTANNNVQQVAFGPESSGTQMAIVTNEAIQLFQVPANARGETKQIGTYALSKYV